MLSSKTIARVVNVLAREGLFHEYLAPNMARPHVLQADRYDKTEMKTNYPFQHTLLIKPTRIELDCVPDGVNDPYRWYGYSLTYRTRTQK